MRRTAESSDFYGTVRGASSWNHQLYPSNKFAEALDEEISINIPQSVVFKAKWDDSAAWPRRHSPLVGPLLREEEPNNAQSNHFKPTTYSGKTFQIR
jgi:hypothetical protein